MGLNVNALYSVNNSGPIIDRQELSRVSEKILNPSNEQSVDVSKLNLSKFNRVQIGVDLYAQKTNSDVVIQAAKTATDFDVKFSENFAQNIQYLKVQAAQNLLTTVEKNGLIAVEINEAVKQLSENEAFLAAYEIVQTKDADKDRKGQNPFAFYLPTTNDDEINEENIFITNNKSVNYFA